MTVTNLFKAIIAMTKLQLSFISQKKKILVDLLGKNETHYF